jgi:hypothetical protein
VAWFVPTLTALALRARRSLGVALGRRSALLRAAAWLAVAASCGLLAVGGMFLGLRLATPGTYSSALGSASFQVRPATHGEVEVFIPLADWGLRAHPFSAPLALHVEPRVLNRQALIAAASGNHAVLRRTEAELSRDGRRALARALRYLVLGVLMAAAFGWGALRVMRRGGRRLQIAVPVGTLIAGLVLGGGLVWRVGATWDSGALERPTYYARGAELIQLLNAADNAQKARDSYVTKVEQAVSGFASLLSDPAAGDVGPGRRALMVSDLHDNTLVLGSLSFYAQGQPVFFAGDFGNSGDASEVKLLAARVAGLGDRVIAVSGNHDSQAMMLALARRGTVVLTSHGQLLADGRYGAPTVVVDGLRVAGFEDPLEYRGRRPDSPKRIFSFGQLPDPDAAHLAAGRLVNWFQSLPQRPDVVLVHENGLAQYLAQTLWASGYDRPLTILTGHDHIQHVNHVGPIDIVDAGTVGAGGLYGVGSNYVGLGELHFDPARPQLAAADLIQVEPVSGVAQAQRIVLPERCGRWRLGCTTAFDYLDPHEGPNTTAIQGLRPVSPLLSAGLGAPAAR